MGIMERGYQVGELEWVGGGGLECVAGGGGVNQNEYLLTIIELYNREKISLRL